MTAVAVVAIAAISVVFSTLIWPTIKANILRSTYCSQADYCDPATCNGGTCTCYYYDEEGEQHDVQCSNKGEGA